MGPETLPRLQRAVKEALTLPMARELVRGHRVGAGIDFEGTWGERSVLLSLPEERRGCLCVHVHVQLWVGL